MSQSLKKKFFQNISTVSIFTMLSRVFGYVRDAAIFIFISNSSHGLWMRFLLLSEYLTFSEEYSGKELCLQRISQYLSDYKNNKEERR